MIMMVSFFEFSLVDAVRLELTTLGLKIPCSNRLSYASICKGKTEFLPLRMLVDAVGFEPTTRGLRVRRSTH